MPQKPLSAPQSVLGWCYLPIYLFLLPLAIRFFLPLVPLAQPELTVNLLYFSVNFLFVLLVFGRFLRQRFFGAGFWNFVQAMIVGIAVGCGGTFAALRLVQTFFEDFSSPNSQTVLSVFAESPLLMTLFGVIAVPITEEVLVRGVIYGSLCRRSRFSAYAASMLFFSAMHVLPYAQSAGWRAVLLGGLLYLPGGFAFAWVYKKTETVWAPITLHALFNAAAFGAAASVL